MFETEAMGLALLDEPGHIRIPKVIGLGQEERTSYLLMEYLETGHRKKGFWEAMGQQLAALHRETNEQFGLDHANFIGSLPQSNNRYDSWPEFYQNERLMPQMRMALDAGQLTTSDLRQLENLCKRLPEICPEEPPALTHGDLWSGNFLVGPDSEPVLIDPSVSYAHREMDLGMSRLFGGFGREFYAAYREAYPLAFGFEQRLGIYQLYYLLVHVNLFGGGYVGSVRGILQRF